MKINRIRLENFRIFRGIHEFNLKNKKVIIIEGANGHGKSTLFDAINWVFTGKINRFSGSSEPLKFNFEVNNYEYVKPTYTTSVEIDLISSDGKINTVKREIHKNLAGKTEKKVIVNDTHYKNLKDGLKIIFELIVKSNFKYNEDKIKSFDSMFSSTQILSQSTLEDFVKIDKPTQRYNKLEDILGLEKFGANFKNYIIKSKNIFDKEFARLSVEIENVENEINILTTRYEENEFILEYSGNNNETYFVDQLNTYFKSLPNYFFGDQRITIENLEETELDKVRRLIKKIKEKSNDLQIIKSKINNFSSLDFSLADQERETNEMYESLIQTNKKLIDKEIEASKAIKRRKKFISMLGQFRELKSLQSELEILNSKKLEIINYQTYINSNLEIKEALKKFGDYDNFVKEFKHQLIQKENYQINLQIFDNSLQLKTIDQDLKNLKIKIESIKAKIEELITKKDESKEVIEQLKLKKVNIQSNSVQQLAFSLQRAVIEKNDEKECRLCGSEFKTVDILLQHIKNKMDEDKKKYDDIELKLSEELSIFSSLEGKISTFYEEMSLFNEKQKALHDKKLVIEKEKIELLQITKELLNQEKEELIFKINESDLFLKSNENIYMLIINMFEKKPELESIKEKIMSKSKEIEKLKHKFENKNKNLNSEELINIRITNIDSYLNANKKRFDQLKISSIEIESNIYESKIKSEEIISVFKKLHADFNINASNFTLMNCLILVEKQLKTQLDSMLEISSKLKNIAAFKEKDKLTMIKIQKELKEEIMKEKVLKRSIVETNISNVDNLKKVHSKVQSDLINKYLLDNSAIINQLFRQISPHAYYKHVKLLTKNNDLYLLLSDKDDLVKWENISNEQLNEDAIDDIKKEVNANLNFSSAQSTILALCVFLSLNLTQNWNSLNMIGIDDPFQYLDDVNIYSFIDVLSSLIYNENKQIFISTHNKNYSDLLITKLSLTKQDLLKISINSYSRSSIDISAENYISK